MSRRYTQAEIEAFVIYSKNGDIANAIGKSVRTVQKMKKDMELQKLVREERSKALQEAIGKLQGALGGAVDVLNEIIQDPTIKPQIRLNAISYLLSACRPMIEEQFTNRGQYHDIEEADPLSKALMALGKEIESDPI